MDGDSPAPTEPGAVAFLLHRLGNVEGQMAAGSSRMDRIETSMSAGFDKVNSRFDTVDMRLKAQDEVTSAKFADVTKGQQEIKDILLVQKTRAGVIAWLGKRFEFVLGALIGAAGSYFGSKG